jgi:hypothetical protein
MNPQNILNYFLNSELMNFIDMFGDIQKMFVSKYLSTIKNMIEFKELYKIILEINQGHTDFAIDVCACMNKFIDQSDFNIIYPRLYLKFQIKCILFLKIFLFLQKVIRDRESEYGIYHFSTKAIFIYTQMIYNLYEYIKKYGDFIQTFSNNKVRIYLDNRVIEKYYKVLDTLLDKNLQILYPKIFDYYKLIYETNDFYNIDFVEAEILFDYIINCVEHMIALNILLYNCIDSQNINIIDDSIKISSFDNFIPEISSLLNKNNYFK